MCRCAMNVFWDPPVHMYQVFSATLCHELEMDLWPTHGERSLRVLAPAARLMNGLFDCVIACLLRQPTCHDVAKKPTDIPNTSREYGVPVSCVDKEDCALTTTSPQKHLDTWARNVEQRGTC
jgi:hypothetical protein